MLIIKVDKNTPIEKALKLYKSKVIKTRQSNEINSRKEFEKKSVVRRKQLLKAKYLEKLKSRGDEN